VQARVKGTTHEARHAARQPCLHNGLALGVQRAGGLVQEQHAWLPDDGARDRDARLLAAAQLHAAAAAQLRAQDKLAGVELA